MGKKKLNPAMIIGGMAVLILMIITEVTGELVLITWISIFVYLGFLGKNLSNGKSQSERSVRNASPTPAQTEELTHVQPSRRVCPSCGKAYSRDALYCSECGSRLVEKN